MSGALSTEIALANIQSSFFEGYHKMTNPGGVGYPMGDPSPPPKKVLNNMSDHFLRAGDGLNPRPCPYWAFYHWATSLALGFLRQVPAL